MKEIKLPRLYILRVIVSCGLHVSSIVATVCLLFFGHVAIVVGDLNKSFF